MRDVQTETGKPLTFCLTFRSGNTYTCAAPSSSEFVEWMQLISAFLPKPPVPSNKPRPLSTIFDSASSPSDEEPAPPARLHVTKNLPPPPPLRAQAESASVGNADLESLEGKVSAKNASLLFANVVCPLFERVPVHTGRCTSETIIPQITEALQDHRSVASNSYSLAALEQFMQENLLAVETTIDSRPLQSVAAFLLMSFIAFLENKDYIAPKGITSPRGHTQQPPAVPSKPGSFRHSPNLERDTTPSAEKPVSGFKPPAGSFKIELGSVHLRKTSFDKQATEGEYESRQAPPKPLKPMLTVTPTAPSSETSGSVNAADTSENEASINFDRLASREKLDTIRRPTMRSMTVMGSSPPMLGASNESGSRHSVNLSALGGSSGGDNTRPQRPKRKPKSRPVSIMLTQMELQAKEESLNEVKPVDEIGETALPPSSDTPEEEEETPKKRFSGVPMFGLGPIPNVGPSMLRRTTGSNHSLKPASKPSIKNNNSVNNDKDDDGPKDFRSLLKSRQHESSKTTPDIPTKPTVPKPSTPSPTVPSAANSSAGQIDFRGLLKRKDSQLKNESSVPTPTITPTTPPIMRSTKSLSTTPATPKSDPPQRMGSAMLSNSTSDGEAKMDFRSVLRKKADAPPPEPEERNSGEGAQQMDFRSILKKRRE